MGLDPKLLPLNVVRLMPAEERKRLGYMTPTESQAKLDAQSEKELHEQVANLLRLRGVRFLGHSRMDKRSTRTVGEPDFIFVLDVFMAKGSCDTHSAVPCAIELKRLGEQPRPEQVRCLADMASDGWHTLVATTLQEVKEWLDSL